MSRYVIAAALMLAVAAGVARAANEMCDDPPCTRRQIEDYQRRIGKHMKRAQQLRFEAMSRGDKGKTDRYDREFKRTQRRWQDATRALATAS